jgi:uncharacterized repeat protein (TIGR02543 family)
MYWIGHSNIYIIEEITSDHTIIAGFELNTYTVTFYSQDAVYTTYTSTHGSNVNAPAVPVREGYIFQNWYTEPACLNAVVFPYLLNGNVAFYAGWTDESVIPSEHAVTVAPVSGGLASVTTDAAVGLATEEIP